MRIVSIISLLSLYVLPGNVVWAGVNGSYIDTDLRYTRCDSKIIQAGWSEQKSLAEIQQLVRSQLAQGKLEVVEQWLKAGLLKTKPKRCPFEDSILSYSDAQFLSQQWSISFEQAQAKISDKLDFILERDLRKMIDSLQSYNVRKSFPDINVEAKTKGFAMSQFDNCHAHMLGKYWKQDKAQAGLQIGTYVVQGRHQHLYKELHAARQVMQKSSKDQCRFEDTHLSEADAKILANYWKISVQEAKFRVVQKYSLGHEMTIPISKHDGK